MRFHNHMVIMFTFTAEQIKNINPTLILKREIFLHEHYPQDIKFDDCNDIVINQNVAIEYSTEAAFQEIDTPRYCDYQIAKTMVAHISGAPSNWYIGWTQIYHRDILVEQILLESAFQVRRGGRDANRQFTNTKRQI